MSENLKTSNPLNCASCGNKKIACRCAGESKEYESEQERLKQLFEEDQEERKELLVKSEEISDFRNKLSLSIKQIIKDDENIEMEHDFKDLDSLSPTNLISLIKQYQYYFDTPEFQQITKLDMMMQAYQNMEDEIKLNEANRLQDVKEIMSTLDEKSFTKDQYHYCATLYQRGYNKEDIEKTAEYSNKAALFIEQSENTSDSSNTSSSSSSISFGNSE